MIKHAKTSTAPNDGIAENVQGSDWNADHTVDDAAALTAALYTFTTTLNGIVPASGGGTANFLRADGLWAKPGYLNTQILTASSGTYTPTAGTNLVHITMIGGGGGGGGVSSGSGVAGGAGGSTGVQLDIWLTGIPITGGDYTNGAGGAGGNSFGGTGQTGGDTTIVINGSTITANGGAGGAGMVNVASPNSGSAICPATTTTGTTAGGVFGYATGRPGVVIGGSVWWGGAGGSCPPLGSGGAEVSGTALGHAGIGFGAGGGGAAVQASTGKIGGAGADGCIIIDEFA